MYCHMTNSSSPSYRHKIQTFPLSYGIMGIYNQDIVHKLFIKNIGILYISVDTYNIMCYCKLKNKIYDLKF